jgi:small conductance mechanosensitive channel
METISDTVAMAKPFQGNVKEAFPAVMEFVLTYGLKLVAAVVALIIGFWLVRKITNSLAKLMERRKIELSLRTFFQSMINVALKILVVISILGMVGIQVTSFIALLGAAGLAIGLSLQGTLQNFAGGIIILLFKPFKIGDFVEAQGFTGTISEIHIVYTYMLTVDNKAVIIPNGDLASGIVTNYSKMEIRRVQWTFGIAYGDNYDTAKMVIDTLIKDDSRILKEPEPLIALSELGNSSVNIVVRGWVATPDFWPVFFDLNEKVYKTFAKEGLHIPFPQMDVHLHQNTKELVG